MPHGSFESVGDRALEGLVVHLYFGGVDPLAGTAVFVRGTAEDRYAYGDEVSHPPSSSIIADVGGGGMVTVTPETAIAGQCRGPNALGCRLEDLRPLTVPYWLSSGSDAERAKTLTRC